MADPQEAGAPEAPAEGTGFLSFLTGSTRLVGAITALVVAIGGLIGALAATGVFSSDGGAKETPATTLFMPTNQVHGRVYFEGKTMYVTTKMPARPFLVQAQADNAYEDVSMTVDARWVSGAGDYGMGLVCRYDTAANYYLVSILSGGRYNIVRYRGGKPKSLTGGIRENGLIDAGSNTIEVRCVDDQPTTISLAVDGQEIAKVRDPGGIASGNVGIRVGSKEAGVTCAFDDFVLHTL